MLPLLFYKSHEEAVLHFQLNQYYRIALLPAWEQGGIMAGWKEGWICLLPSLLRSVPCVSIHWFAGSIQAAV